MKWGIIMQRFMRKFEQLNGVGAKVTIEHCLFDSQQFICPSLKVLCDNDTIGLLLREHKIFMYNQDVKVAEVHGNIYKVSDGRLAITVNKL